MSGTEAGIRARPAVEADLARLVEGNLRLAEESEERRLDPGRVGRGVAAILSDSRRGRYWVAEGGGAVRGQCLVTLEASDWLDGTYWWLQSVWVDPGWRRRGVFRALWEAVLAAGAESEDFVGLRLYVERGNRPARAVYERLGMEETGYLVYHLPRDGAG